MPPIKSMLAIDPLVERMTSAQIAFIRPGDENRQTRRRIVNFAAVLETASEPLHNVRIKDLSERGCRASVDGPISVEKGSLLMIKLPAMEAIRARVIWSSEDHIGCAFEEELHPAAIDQVLGRGSMERRPLVMRRSVFGLKGSE